MTLVRRPTPALLGLAAFAAGVAVGLFTDAPVRWGIAGSLLLGSVVLGRVRVWALIALIGVGHGAAGRFREASRCAAVLPRGPLELTVRLVEPAARDRPARAIPSAPCTGLITIRQRARDTLWAGTVLRLEGRWAPRDDRWHSADGILIVGQITESGRPSPTWSEQLRNRLASTIDRLYGPRAGMIEALVLGGRGTIDPILSQAFARAGLVHLLSISGFHVGLVWAWVLILLGPTRFRRVAPVVATGIVVCYVGFIGMPAPATRAAMLAILSAVEVRRQRAVAPGALAAIVAWLVVVADPWAVTDLGGWLSVSALWGATVATRWSDRALGKGGWVAVVASSVGATVATAPLTALTFGSASLIGIALNLVAIPLAAVALPPVLLSLLVPPSTMVAQALAAGGGVALGALELLAVNGAKVPGAALTFEPGLGPAALAGLVIAAFVWVFGRGNRPGEVTRRLGWSAACLAVGTWVAGSVPRIHGAAGLTLDFLSVGQGDAALIKTSRGHWILVDAGPSDDRGDAGRRFIVPFLVGHGVRELSAVLLSHAHRDHFGGLPSVVEAVRVDAVYEPGVAATDQHYLDLLDRLEDQGVAWHPLQVGDSLVVDEVRLAVVHPDPKWEGFGEDLNENSLVIHLVAGRFDAILSGDAGFAAESRLAQQLGPVELLKVGHHGSRTATSAAWLAQIRPAVAVISVGSNGYGHPSAEALGRLEAAGVAVWRTDQAGTVHVEVGPASFSVEGRDGTRIFPLSQP